MFTRITCRNSSGKCSTRNYDANSVVTIDSPSSGFEEICGQIEKYLELEVFEVQPFSIMMDLLI